MTSLVGADLFDLQGLTTSWKWGRGGCDAELGKDYDTSVKLDWECWEWGVGVGEWLEIEFGIENIWELLWVLGLDCRRHRSENGLRSRVPGGDH
ncbi:hypothetical protein J1614_010945 [Plenodomus biglobosus]|nr:hypothetical protein J1614_010945 [Plenodomus biglobosus]